MRKLAAPVARAAESADRDPAEATAWEPRTPARRPLPETRTRADKAAEDVVDIASQLEHAEATITRLQDKWTSVIFSPEPGADY